MSKPIDQPGATTASIPLPKGWVLDKGEQPREPKEGENYLTLSECKQLAEAEYRRRLLPLLIEVKEATE